MAVPAPAAAESVVHAEPELPLAVVLAPARVKFVAELATAPCGFAA